MNVIQCLYFIATIVAVVKSSAEVDDVSLLAQSLVESKHLIRGSGLNGEKETEKKDEETSVNQISTRMISKHMLEAGTKRLLQLMSINDNEDDKESEERFLASDGECFDFFGGSCSMSDDLVVIGAPESGLGLGASYLFNLDGTEVAKLTAGDDGEAYDLFGGSVSMDENFGDDVATLGNLIVTIGEQDSIWKLFIYSAEDGQLLKSLEHEDEINVVAISEQFIVLTFSDYYGGGKTIIYSNTSPDFPEISEINQGGRKVAVSSERLVIVGGDVAVGDGAAYLYKTDGTLVTTLDRQDASSESYFGGSVAITDDRVLVNARFDDDDGKNTGSIFIYSADTGEFVEKVVDPDGEVNDYIGHNWFGFSVCASDSHYVVGAPYANGVGDGTGAAYLFQLSE